MSSVAAGAAAPESPEKESADRQAPELNPRTDAWGRAAQRLKRNPFDYDAWMLIVEEAKGFSSDVTTSVMERFIERFPSTGRFWVLYIEHEMRQGNAVRVEELFKRSLVSCLSLPLWRLYLRYILESKKGQADYKDVVTKAFEYVMDTIGRDLGSIVIYKEWIAFVKQQDAPTPYLEGVKMTTLRQAYRRAVREPIIDVEHLYREYDTFENSLNKATARKLLQEIATPYNNARAACQQRRNLVPGLDRNLPATPPSHNEKDLQQMRLWQKLIDWEKSNPLKLEDNEVPARVVFVYRQALMVLRLYPNVWLSYLNFLRETESLADQVSDVFDEAMNVLPKNMLIAFACADYHEENKRMERAGEVYTSLLERLSAPDDDPTLVYLQMMRFRWRSDTIEKARLPFKIARRDPRCSHEVYVASALMEFHHFARGRETSSKIFELGMKNFGESESYMLSYLEHLMHLEDDNNTRATFNRVLSSLPSDESRAVWALFVAFEAQHGTLEALHNVIRRRDAALPAALAIPPMHTLIDRYRHADRYPCSPLELSLFAYVPDASASDAPAMAGASAGAGAGVAAMGSFVDAMAGSDADDSANALPKPNLKELKVFQPPVIAAPFKPQPAIEQLLGILPAPHAFRGPFVVVDALMELIVQVVDAASAAAAAAAPGGGGGGGGAVPPSGGIKRAPGEDLDGPRGFSRPRLH